ncbi:hypothetical protein CGMCC3_g728 [Colletotrichum fructicola]|uniref:Uncharacterized protein n=1 Tax=Colletotrichum fructicola (strain Nara gc5) TaxID=1213859 RepID=A0A7J6J796_COLFN|nr:uncharacterized protein CGMCC3_g728 [Colletotrichum fructicola]KAE9583319.1 hypothetical protein CGMCC3_g728 [Colletotrichum fructicola]KAF4485436.1 hypothetical protein CGGC5_v007033 [Colletotrichum fructicola Nara gc5]KAF4882950.1 hypothetical protein CGCFRS4_v014068 [Colletotrichum fructicola]
MGSQFPDHFQAQPCQEHPETTAANTKSSDTKITTAKANINWGFKDMLALYFDSDLPWSHVDAVLKDAKVEPSRDDGERKSHK